jgi:DNA-3-methyladenine glycosylase II
MLLTHWLERTDLLPPSDFGVREGYRVLKSFPEQPTPPALRELAQAS